jgi:hypothetical protein
MKLFNNKKRREPIHRPLIRNDDQGYHEYDSSAMHSDYAVHMQAMRDRTLEQERLLEQEYNSRKNLGDWMKTLNCTASKKGDRFDDLYTVSPVRNPREIPWTNDTIDADITRPVVITVKDGDVPHWASLRATSSGPPANDFTTSFSVGANGEAPPKSPSRFNLFRRGSKKSASDGEKDAVQYISKEMDDMMSSEELARRNRWRKGIERSWKDDGDIPSLFEDESVLTGCRSTFTGGESFATGFTNATAFTRGSTHTNGSVTTGYTTDVTEDSDESEMYGSPARNNKSSRPAPIRPPYGNAALSTVTTTSLPRRRIKKPSTSGNPFLAGMAEDLGIIAGLLLSDGNACFGGVADITRDTITSCKPQE